MFFGRREPEKVSVDKLGQLLDLQFEKKLDQLESKARTITENLNRVMLRFSDACDRFEALDAEPYTEDLYFANMSSIKKQKSQYAKGLGHILSRTSFEAGEVTNSYKRYGRVLSELEGMIKRILEANANFKTVLYCYSNNLGEFKSLFSEIERLAKALRGELDNRSKDFSEYSAVGEHVSKLNYYSEELGSLSKSIETFRKDAKPGNESALDKGKPDILKGLSDKRDELTRLNKERASLHNEINSLTLPLERVSKKLDHLSASKKQLHTFVENPINTINNESEYNEFRALVQALNEKMHTGAIDVKNSDKVSKTASMLLNSDIYSMITSFKSYQQKVLEISREIETLERNLNELNKGRTASERYAQEIDGMERKASEIEKSRKAEKSTIETLFLDRYGILISIID